MAFDDHTPRTRINGHPRQNKPARTTRFAALREAWDAAWAPGGPLHSRWEDVRTAPELGWHGMANWLKAASILAAGSLVVLLFNAAVDTVLQALHHLLTAAPHVRVGTDTSTGVWAVIDNPVRTYLAHHSAGLPISASTVYTLWLLFGLIGLIGGLLRSAGCRMTWLAWGAATVAMVWTAAPADARTVATGITVLAWTLASVVALHGLSLRPTVFAHLHHDAPQLRPQASIPAQPTAPTEDTPGTVHPLQR